jgi:predicted lipoprotein with Yx(FWY)xxD motif
MNMIKAFPVISVFAIAAALAVAGCGDSSSSGSGGSSAYGSGESTGSTKAASSESGGAVAVAGVGDIGKVLVDSKGMTLYYFEKDKGGKSACYSACASAWPPLTTSGAPGGTSGVEASKLGTTKRSDGTVQVTYAGWPLYTYVADRKPGEDNGTDVKSFGATWYPLHPNGEKAGE